MPQVAPGLVKKLKTDSTPLTTGETRTINVKFDRVTSIGGDIKADQTCTLQVFPILSDGTQGKGSDLLSITAGSPDRFTYIDLYSNEVDVVIVNTGGSNMTDFIVDIYGVI